MTRAALSLEKLADTAREELPGTMAAIRLSGMEISDLTLELSDLSQEITEGVRKSQQAVQAAEVGIRHIGVIISSQATSMLQERANLPVVTMKPAVVCAAEKTSRVVQRAQRHIKQQLDRNIFWEPRKISLQYYPSKWNAIVLNRPSVQQQNMYLTQSAMVHAALNTPGLQLIRWLLGNHLLMSINCPFNLHQKNCEAETSVTSESLDGHCFFVCHLVSVESRFVSLNGVVKPIVRRELASGRLNVERTFPSSVSVNRNVDAKGDGENTQQEGAGCPGVMPL
eukprot:Gb_34107 [translate_table: standard]